MAPAAVIMRSVAIGFSKLTMIMVEQENPLLSEPLTSILKELD